MKLHDNQWVDACFKLIIITTLCYKLFQSNIAIDFATLLSLILALFSIWLSVVFCHRAEDSSNNFYNHVFQFTKDSSIMLGKIEAAFGEKLDNMGRTLERYSSSKQDGMEKLEEETKNEQKVIDQQQALIEDLMSKAQLAEHDKEVRRAQLNDLQSQLDKIKKSKNELEFDLRAEEIKNTLKLLSPSDINTLMVFIKCSLILIQSGDLREVNSRFFSFLNEVTIRFRNKLKNIRMIDQEGNLTNEGLEILKFIVTNRIGDF